MLRLQSLQGSPSTWLLRKFLSLWTFVCIVYGNPWGNLFLLGLWCFQVNIVLQKFRASLWPAQKSKMSKESWSHILQIWVKLFEFECGITWYHTCQETSHSFLKSQLWKAPVLPKSVFHQKITSLFIHEFFTNFINIYNPPPY